MFVALADDPDAQTQYPVGWVPGDGNLIVYGLGGSGTTTALTSVVLAMARQRTPDDLHVYALDFGAGELEALSPLPHVGGVVLAGERERQTRLVRHLRGELDRRRAMGGGRGSGRARGRDRDRRLERLRRRVQRLRRQRGVGGRDPGAGRRARGRACTR